MGESGQFPWLLALGLMLVFEGLLPLVAPNAWREMMQRVSTFSDGQIRFVGLAAVAVGLLVFAAGS
ncbi:MAG: DUF2065 domain-containing protein [Lautropia sp.]